MSTGQAHYISHPATSPLKFNLSIDDHDSGDMFSKGAEDSDSRLMAMLAAKQAHQEDSGAAADIDAVTKNDKMSEQEKKSLLQKTLHMAASNGEVDRVRQLFNGSAKQFIDINAADEEGTAPLIYASCFVRRCYWLVNVGANLCRAITKWSPHSSKLELSSTARTAISGRR
jgi:hypothetical protein